MIKNYKKFTYALVIFGIFGLSLPSEKRYKFLFYLFIGFIYFIVSTYLELRKRK